jgi:F420-0:gamma-glutamyl ligase-like protein
MPWKRMFRKRVVKLEEIRRDNPHAAVELKKRLLQQAALSLALIAIIEETGVPWEAVPGASPSNLPQYADPFGD